MADEVRKVSAVYQIEADNARRQLKNLNEQFKLNQAEMNKASQKMKLYGADNDTLKQKTSVLANQIKTLKDKWNLQNSAVETSGKRIADYKTKLDALAKEKASLTELVKKAASEHGKESEQYEKLEEKLKGVNAKQKETQASYERSIAQGNKYKNELVQTETELIKIQKEFEDTNKSLNTHGNKWVETQAKISAVATQLDTAAGKMKSFGDKMTTRVTLPLGMAGIASAKFAMDFEDGLAKISTIADETKKPIAEIKKEIMAMSSESGRPLGELTDGFYELLSAGIPTERAMSVLTVANKAAIGGFTDTATAVDGLTTMLNSYGLEATEADRIANQMLVTQNLGKTTYGELAQSIGKVSPVAKALGLDTAELFSSLSVTTSQGLQTSEAITGLKAAMTNIIKPSKEAKDATEALGIDFSVSALKTKGWIGMLKDVRSGISNAVPAIGEITSKLDANSRSMLALEKAGKKGSDIYKKLKKENKDLAKELEIVTQSSDSTVSGLAQIFGSVEGLNSVLMITSDEGMKLYNESMNQMKTNTSALNDAFSKMDTTPGAKTRKALNELKVTAVEIGDIVLPIISDLMGQFRNLVKGFQELSPETQKTLVKMAGYAMVLGPLAKTTGSLLSGTSALIKVFGKLAPVATSVASATTAVGEAATVAGGSAALGGFATSLGGIIVAAAPYVAAAAAIGIAGYGIYKVLSEKVVPEVDLFKDEVIKTEAVFDEKGRLISEASEKTATKITENTKKQVGAYLELETKFKTSLIEINAAQNQLTKENTEDLLNNLAERNKMVSEATSKHQAAEKEKFIKFLSDNKGLSEKEQADALVKLENNQKEERLKYETSSQKIKDIITKASAERRVLTDQERVEIGTLQDQMKTTAINTLSTTEEEARLIRQRIKDEAGNITTQMYSDLLKKSIKSRDDEVRAAQEKYDGVVREAGKLRDAGLITADQYNKMVAVAKDTKDKTIQKATESVEGIKKELQKGNPGIWAIIDNATGEIKSRWQIGLDSAVGLIQYYVGIMKDKFYSIVSYAKRSASVSPVTGETHGSLTNSALGKYALGTTNAIGGLAYVNEQGYEMMNLPAGTKIRNHTSSVQMAQDIANKTAESVARQILNSLPSGTPIQIFLDKELIGEALAPIVGNKLGRQKQQIEFSRG